MSILDAKGFFDRVSQVMGTDSAPEIARQLGVTKHTAYAWRDGKMPGMNRLVNLFKVAEMKGCSIHWLFTGQEHAANGMLKAQDAQHIAETFTNSYLSTRGREEFKKLAEGKTGEAMAKLAAYLLEMGIVMLKAGGEEWPRKPDLDRPAAPPVRKRKDLTRRASKRKRTSTR